eukprot:GHVP01021285.1.p1 GENE.GHVP01021285.1~~GHVP01021285.1.p1  ORF type:complete len:261 (+),score=35.97 GHVP01021285.1:46-828(+)
MRCDLVFSQKPQFLKFINRAKLLGLHGLAFCETIDLMHGVHCGKLADFLPPQSKENSFDGKLKFEELSLLSPSPIDSVYSFRAVSINCHNIEDANFVNKFSKNSRPVDILIVRPTDQRVWFNFVETADVDMISIDFSAPEFPFPIKKKQILLAARRNIFFEIRLSDINSSDEARVFFFRNVQTLVRFLPASQVIITSGARKEFEIRSCADREAIASILGFSPKAAKQIGNESFMGLLQRGGARKAAAGMIVYPKRKKETL